MKKTIIITTLFFGFFNAFGQYYPNKRQSAQSELETLEKLNNMMENDRNNELKAKQIVLSYNYGLKDIIYEKREKLTIDEFNYMLDYQSNLWKNFSSYLSYYNSYQKFYEKFYSSLEKYKSMVMDKLYELMYN